MKNYRLSSNKNLAVFGFLFAIVFVIYGNTFHASWHMDDYHNIVDNPHLHITDIKPETVIQTFYSSYNGGKYRSEKLYRPVACLSFALNWYFGGSNVFGYHIVNIIIHLLAAFILYLVIRKLLQSPEIGGEYRKNEFIIAIFSAALWVAAPIQTQAVTYIVQRMASLSAMFYLLGLYCFLKGRTDLRFNYRWLYYVFCFICFLLALGSKENAITMPLALVLTEIVFFQKPGILTKRKPLFCIFICGIVGVFFLLLFREDLLGLLSYKIRAFTLKERLLTEPRILLFYLGQIFFPRIQSLSIAHDVIVSRSLFVPWTTLPSIIAVIALLVAGFFFLRRRPLVSFGILFFFLTHLIESTVIPLELIFEHRNYLPSCFLFLTVIAEFIRAGKHYRIRDRAIAQVVTIFMVIVIFVFGYMTWNRNFAWRTEKSLWEDVLIKVPLNERPYHNLAWGHYMRVGEFDRALQLFEKALTFTNPKRKDRLAATYHNMGNCYYQMGDYENAVKLYGKAVDVYPNHEKALYNLAMALAVQGKWEQASRNMDLLLSKDERRKEYLTLKSLVLLKLRKANEALACLNKVLPMDRKSYKALLNAGVALNLTGKHREAEKMLGLAKSLYPDDMIIYFAIIENSIRADNLQKADFLIEKMFEIFGTNKIVAKFGELSGNNLYVPLSMELLGPVIDERVNEIQNSKKEIQND